MSNGPTLKPAWCCFSLLFFLFGEKRRITENITHLSLTQSRFECKFKPMRISLKWNGFLQLQSSPQSPSSPPQRAFIKRGIISGIYGLARCRSLGTPLANKVSLTEAAERNRWVVFVILLGLTRTPYIVRAAVRIRCRGVWPTNATSGRWHIPWGCIVSAASGYRALSKNQSSISRPGWVTFEGGSQHCSGGRGWLLLLWCVAHHPNMFW